MENSESSLSRYPLEFQNWILASEKNRAALPTWDALDNPEDLIEAFLTFPSTIKWRIISALRKGVSFDSVNTFYTLCRTVREIDPEKFPIEYVDVAKVNNKVLITEQSKKFRVGMMLLNQRLKKDLQVGDRETYLEWRYQVAIFKLLSEIHGEPLIGKIIAGSIKMPVFPNLTTILTLIEKWDEYKEYPVEWILNVIDGSGNDD